MNQKVKGANSSLSTVLNYFKFSHSETKPKKVLSKFQKEEIDAILPPSDMNTIVLNQITMFLASIIKKYSLETIGVADIQVYLKEVCKRSRSTKTVVFLAAIYLDKIYSNWEPMLGDIPKFARCVKRVFLSCLIIAHKFANDKTFSMRSWSSISGLGRKAVSYTHLDVYKRQGYLPCLESLT